MYHNAFGSRQRMAGAVVAGIVVGTLAASGASALSNEAIKCQDSIAKEAAKFEQTVLDRVTNLPGSAFTAVNDLDYALRVVALSDAALPAGTLFTVEFDTCKKPAFKVSDLECVVEDAADASSNPIAGVTCSAAFTK